MLFGVTLRTIFSYSFYLSNLYLRVKIIALRRTLFITVNAGSEFWKINQHVPKITKKNNINDKQLN